MKGMTLHRRLRLFFIGTSVTLIFIFTILLMLFGIDGKQEHNVKTQLSTELTSLADSIESDFGRISLGGISIAETLSVQSDRFFTEQAISAGDLSKHPELIEPLLAEYMQTLIHTIKTRYCGGVFVLLDTSIQSTSDTSRAGVFLKKTQPTSNENVGVNIHYLRGPAKLARDNDIMLLGQWKMEYDTEDQTFWDTVMQTARDNPQLPLSRLYYWTGRTVLKGNSEAGFLLCVPLQSSDGTVFGVCGIEVSDRMFKSLYTPTNGNFNDIFTVMAPLHEDSLHTSKGLLAGNQYLSGTRWTDNLQQTDTHDNFIHYSGSEHDYSGQIRSIKLYSDASPYTDETWAIALLMPQEILHEAVAGRQHVFICVILLLLILAVAVSFFISQYYMKPVHAAFEHIRSKGYADSSFYTRIPEIDDLFAFLAQQDKEYEDQMTSHRERYENMRNEAERLAGEKSALQTQVAQIQTDNSRLAYLRKDEVDPDSYKMFVARLHTLSPREKAVFELYVEGKTAKEIVLLLNFTDNGLKYHNKNIYSKLGVSSRKELLKYITILKQEQAGI